MWYYRVYPFAVERETTALFQNFVIKRADPDGSPRRDPNLDEPLRFSWVFDISLSAPWHNMAVSCCLGHRSFTLEEKNIIDLSNRYYITDCGSKIVENSSWVSVSKRARHHPFDLDSARLDWLHLSGFRFADYQHYLLQHLCYAYWNKTREKRYKYSYSESKVFGCKCVSSKKS